MAASSGLQGFCKACDHANNEHNKRQCPSPGCRFMWKMCQVTGGCYQNGDWKHRICKT
ncbi:hypothetical protein RUND412_011682, partial [Rhizina undulata]